MKFPNFHLALFEWGFFQKVSNMPERSNSNNYLPTANKLFSYKIIRKLEKQKSVVRQQCFPQPDIRTMAVGHIACL